MIIFISFGFSQIVDQITSSLMHNYLISFLARVDLLLIVITLILIVIFPEHVTVLIS
jgi:hypothetical protein